SCFGLHLCRPGIARRRGSFRRHTGSVAKGLLSQSFGRRTHWKKIDSVCSENILPTTSPTFRSQEMKKVFAVFALFFVVLCARALGQQPASQQLPMMHMSGILGLVETIPLPGDGYMDHLAVDVKGQRLFISGEAEKTLITVDLGEGKVIHVTEGLSAMPKKPFFLPETNEIWVALTDS